MKILVLTSNYESDDLPKWITRVVHYFAKEWKKNGHVIQIVYNYTVFSSLFYTVLKIAEIFSSKAGFLIGPNKNKDRNYIIDDVNVFRFNIKKTFPRFPFSKYAYGKQFQKICNIIDSQSKLPDIIIAHWLTPNLKLLYELKAKYNIPTCIVIHESYPIIKRDYPIDWKKYIENVNVIGFRSQTIKEQFINRYSIINIPSFICLSGIPEKTVETYNVRKFKKPLLVFTFVGILISRKYPEALLYALNDYHAKSELIINYIGSGYLTKKLKKLSRKLNLTANTTFYNQLSREQVIDKLLTTDVFVMISRDETFGLVYIEAMACGCITIAAKNEGMEGIIKHGINGFLCEAGNYNELNKLIENISNMHVDELNEISKAAYFTAKKLTETTVAKNYLNNVISNI